MDLIREWWRKTSGYWGAKIYGVAFNIDIVDGQCPVSCPSCAVGSIGRRPKRLMSIDFFREILDKAESECKVRNVQLYAYSEPTMHPELHLFVQECTDRGIPAIVSTVLQHSRCDWQKVVEARPVEIRVSFPGWKHMNYYQKGAKPEVFDKNFSELMTLPRYPETTWTMGFHVYRDTVDELPEVRALAKKWGLKLVALPSIFMENSKNATLSYSEQDMELIGRLFDSPEEEVKKYIRSDWCVCYKQVTISATGMTWLCQNTYNIGPLMPFMESSVPVLRRMIRNHPFCVKCKDAGMNMLQEKYGYFFEDEPLAKADRSRVK